MSLTRYVRGPRAGIARTIELTGAEVAWDFTGPDETRQLHAPTNERWERAVTPSKALVEACKRLDAYGRRRDP